MINRAVFDYEIGKICEIAQKYPESGFNKSVERIEKIKDDFDIKVMVVGHFNAGKSALINALLGKENFLVEQQRPETAIATELHYAETMEIFAVTNQGNRESIEKTSVANPESYNHLEVYVPSPALKEVSDFTVVDTPGFDSGLEAHNTALASYVHFGAAYVLVIDAEHGGIDYTSLRFLNEICKYSNKIAVVINKCDKQTPSNISLIKASAEETLQEYGYDIPVYCVSKYDPDITRELTDIIQGFNSQKIFNEIMHKKLAIEASNAIQILNMYRRKLSFNTYDVDVEINRYQRALEQIKTTFEMKKKEASGRVASCTQEIIGEVRSALQAKDHAVAEAALCGGSAGMEAVIAEAIRPVIIAELKKFSSAELDSITRAIDFTNILDAESSKSLAAIVKNLAEDTKDLIENGTFSRAILGLEKERIKKRRGKDVYHVLGGIAALATNVVAPWLEIAIIILPDAVQLLGSLFGETDKERVIRQYRNSIIPQITSKMYDMLEPAVLESHEALMLTMQSAIEEKVSSVNDLLCKAKKEKEMIIENYNTYSVEIEKDLDILEVISVGKVEVNG